MSRHPQKFSQLSSSSSPVFFFQAERNFAARAYCMVLSSVPVPLVRFNIPSPHLGASATAVLTLRNGGAHVTLFHRLKSPS